MSSLVRGPLLREPAEAGPCSGSPAHCVGKVTLS